MTNQHKFQFAGNFKDKLTMDITNSEVIERAWYIWHFFLICAWMKKHIKPYMYSLLFGYPGMVQKIVFFIRSSSSLMTHIFALNNQYHGWRSSAWMFGQQYQRAEGNDTGMSFANKRLSFADVLLGHKSKYGPER